ncbi:alpha/beta hydrolase [Mesorhizobium sp. C386A]|uniref:alpha/beta fold hydrolase n=1 Tax=unclassified Mesorhizobium TaxID=325217 RepID=UPI0003CEC59D|nr:MULTISPECIES: alpha/beta hydrolase [unclassified Mesorhizobium]ESY11276.1 alpha/beta hydrolase [Mesorhizobium sp. LNJC398B00]ESY30827.1 alpha/beta hydrolase [Mesorhizobium sp. LNJC386A00]
MKETFSRDGVDLAYRDVGAGLPVIFQHGLGGDDAQVADVFPDLPVTRRVTLECRGQGGSSYGPVERLSVATFAEDVEALADALGIGSAVVGGISMGAALALRLAVHRPARVRALVLARPAWVSEPAPANMRPYAVVGDLLMRHSPDARRLFDDSAVAAELARLAPDNLASLQGFFNRPDPVLFGRLLVAIAGDGPGVSEADIRAIAVPTLVIGHDHDLVHRLDDAQTLAGLIPSARLCTITAKSQDRAAYRLEFRACLSEFLEPLA